MARFKNSKLKIKSKNYRKLLTSIKINAKLQM